MGLNCSIFYAIIYIGRLMGVGIITTVLMVEYSSQ